LLTFFTFIGVEIMVNKSSVVTTVNDVEIDSTMLELEAASIKKMFSTVKTMSMLEGSSLVCVRILQVNVESTASPNKRAPGFACVVGDATGMFQLRMWERIEGNIGDIALVGVRVYMSNGAPSFTACTGLKAMSAEEFADVLPMMEAFWPAMDLEAPDLSLQIDYAKARAIVDNGHGPVNGNAVWALERGVTIKSFFGEVLVAACAMEHEGGICYRTLTDNETSATEWNCSLHETVSSALPKVTPQAMVELKDGCTGCCCCFCFSSILDCF
jgi:hypothetical protein